MEDYSNMDYDDLVEQAKSITKEDIEGYVKHYSPEGLVEFIWLLMKAFNYNREIGSIMRNMGTTFYEIIPLVLGYFDLDRIRENPLDVENYQIFTEGINTIDEYKAKIGEITQRYMDGL